MAPPTAAEYAAILHDRLKPEAMAIYRKYILERTPHDQQSAMEVLIETDLDTAFEPDANTVMITHGASIVVQDNGGGVNAKSPGIANVTLGTLNYVRLAA